MINTFRHLPCTLTFMQMDNDSELSVTCVQSDAYPDGNVRHVPHLESSHGAKDVESHVGYFCSVAVAVGDGNPGRHHVSVTYRLHLGKDTAELAARLNEHHRTEQKMNEAAPCRRRGFL